MSEILTFSEKAKIRLKEIMSTKNHKDTLGLRISVTSGGCAGMTYKMDYVQKKKDGDEIIIDAVKNEINVNVSQEKLDLRKKSWIKPDLKFKSGILYKYSKLVSSASKGCVTD